MTHSITLNLNNIAVRQLDGLYSLNDLHKAAGGEQKNEPNKFIRLDQTQDLIKELAKCPELGISIKTVRGAKGGTFVAKELVYAYGMWISPAFMLAVIQTFDAVQNAAAALPPPVDCISKHQAHQINSGVNDMATRKNYTHKSVWTMVYNGVGRGDYKTFTQMQYLAACNYLGLVPMAHDAVITPRRTPIALTTSVKAATEAPKGATPKELEAVYNLVLYAAEASTDIKGFLAAQIPLIPKHLQCVNDLIAPLQTLMLAHKRYILPANHFNHTAKPANDAHAEMREELAKMKEAQDEVSKMHGRFQERFGIVVS
jgi:hypothetical protein